VKKPLIILVIIVFTTLVFTVSCKKDPASSNDPITVTDIDGNVYETVIIGDQVWMTENLKVIHYRNGDSILNITDIDVWSNMKEDAYCSYNNDDSNIDIYGLLYNWYAVDDSREIAPEGWHIPTDDEWKQLEMYLGMSKSEADTTRWRGTDEGGKLKGTTYWNSPNTGATNISGFTAIPGGDRNYGGIFFSENGYWWSSTEQDSYTAWYRTLYFDKSVVGRHNADKRDGFSVRCIKD